MGQKSTFKEVIKLDTTQSFLPGNAKEKKKKHCPSGTGDELWETKHLTIFKRSKTPVLCFIESYPSVVEGKGKGEDREKVRQRCTVQELIEQEDEPLPRCP